MPDVRLITGEPRAVDARLLSGADADGLSALGVADRIGLRIFERNQRDEQVALGLLRQVLALCDDVGKHFGIDFHLVASLLEGDAEHLLCFDGRGDVIRVDCDDIVAALALLLEDFQRRVGIAGRKDPVGDLVLDGARGGLVADVGE